MAVLIPGRHADVRLAFNGQPLETTRIIPYQSTGIYAVLPQMVEDVPGVLELRLRSRAGMQSRLEPVLFGDSDVLSILALRQSLQLTFVTTIAFGILFVAAVAILVAAIIQGQASLFALSFVLFTLAIRQGTLFVFDSWSDDAVELAFLLGNRYLTLIGIAVAMPMLARQRYADLLLLAFVLSAMAVALLLTGWGSLSLRRGVLLLFSGLVLLLALQRSWRALLLTRQWVWLSFFGVILFNYLSVLVDWATSSDKLRANTLDKLSLSSILILLCLSCYIMMRLRRSYRESRNHNIELSEEVQRYKAEFQQVAAREQQAALVDASRRQYEHWLREIHDGVGSQLVAARILSERKDTRNADAIVDTLKEALEQLNMLMTALAPGSCNFANLLGDMRYRLMPRLEAMGYSISWSSIDISEIATLSAETAMSIQRLIHEVLANALKHSRCTELKIDIHELAGSYVIQIDDNGIGFDIKKVPIGRGIPNLRTRATEFGGSIRWSMLSPGTRVELTLPHKG
jgi:signal transduction histidine kinase